VSINSTKYSAGRQQPEPIVLDFATPAGTKLHIRNIKLKPLGLQSIFNGKDLAGWKEIPGHKSKFSVNDKGS